MLLTIFVELWSEMRFFPKQNYTAQKRTEHISKEVELRPVTGIKYAAKSSVVPHPHNKDDLFPYWCKSCGFIILQQKCECKISFLPTIWRGEKTKSFKVESNLQPYETYSSPVFVHGCKHLDLVYDLGRAADSVLLPSRSHTSLSIFIPHEATS